MGIKQRHSSYVISTCIWIVNVKCLMISLGIERKKITKGFILFKYLQENYGNNSLPWALAFSSVSCAVTSHKLSNKAVLKNEIFSYNFIHKGKIQFSNIVYNSIFTFQKERNLCSKHICVSKKSVLWVSSFDSIFKNCQATVKIYLFGILSHPTHL